jgi:hypothetical protein
MTEKKKSSDYPQFNCRMKSTDKTKINNLLDKIIKIETKKIGPDDYLPKRNDYIVRALKIGLLKIKEEVSE